MKKKYYIKDLTEGQVIHAPTREIAEKLCKKFHELGLKWRFGESYLEMDKWEDCKKETCYRPTNGSFSSKEYYEYSNYEILTIDQLYDFDETLKIEEVQIQNKINNNVKNKYWIKDLNENQVIHAPTQEIAEKICKKFHELGFKWCTGESYLDLINWFDYKDNTYYNPVDGSYCSKEWCEKINYEILTTNQLLDFDEALEVKEETTTKQIHGSEEEEKDFLEIAKEIITSDRLEDYGDTEKSFTNISKGWEIIFKEGVTPRKVALAMIWLKVCRDINKPKDDNIIDIAGYAGCIGKFKN